MKRPGWHATSWMIVVLLPGVTGLSACSDAASISAAGRSQEVSRTAFKGAWPFTVETGLLGCTQPQSVTFKVNGTVYGVNASALDIGLAPVDPILARDPRHPGVKPKLGDLINQGLALCRGS